MALKRCLKWETIANPKPPSLERAPEGTARWAGKRGQTQPPLSQDLGFFCMYAAFVLSPGDVPLLLGGGGTGLHPPGADAAITAGLAQPPAPV